MFFSIRHSRSNCGQMLFLSPQIRTQDLRLYLSTLSYNPSDMSLSDSQYIVQVFSLTVQWLFNTTLKMYNFGFWKVCSLRCKGEFLILSIAMSPFNIFFRNRFPLRCKVKCRIRDFRLNLTYTTTTTRLISKKSIKPALTDHLPSQTKNAKPILEPKTTQKSPLLHLNGLALRQSISCIVVCC